MAKKESNSNKSLYIAILVLGLSLVAFAISLNLESLATLQESEVPISVIISDYQSINISKNQSDLNLGRVRKGGFGERSLDVSSDYPFQTVFEFEATGDIAHLLVFDSVVLFEPMEDKSITFRTKVIENESFGSYSGVIHVKVKKFIEK